MEQHWQAHKDQLRRYVAQRMADPSAVDDVLQEIYLKAHTQLHQLKSQGSLGAWLYRIAHNAIMDHYRRQRSEDELPDTLQAPEPDQAERAHQALARCLRPLITELPDKYREPLELAELEGMKQQAIADRLGLSLSGAKSRIQRGREQLRQRITACCDVEVGAGGVVDFQPKNKGCERC